MVCLVFQEWIAARELWAVMSGQLFVKSVAVACARCESMGRLRPGNLRVRASLLGVRWLMCVDVATDDMGGQCRSRCGFYRALLMVLRSAPQELGE
jgi:hypothetical protein